MRRITTLLVVDATARVGRLTGDPLPTAWNAVEHADPIDVATCRSEEHAP